jgi:hypothetical protein
MSVWLTPEQAAIRLGEIHNLQCNPRRLAYFRYAGGGPQFHRIGAKVVRYHTDAIDAWAAERLGKPISSTAEESERRRA